MVFSLCKNASLNSFIYLKLALKNALFVLLVLVAFNFSFAEKIAIAEQNCITQKQTGSGDVVGNFDFYIFSLAWYPTFCLESSNPADQPCSVFLASNDNFLMKNFGVHGLWPQYGDGKSGTCLISKNYPEQCINSPGCSSSSSCNLNISQFQPSVYKKSQSIIQTALMIHEWPKHGTCSGYNQNDYFAKINQLQEQYGKMPDSILQNISGTISYSQIKSFYQNALVICSNSGSKQYLSEIRMILRKDFTIVPLAESTDIKTNECSQLKPIYLLKPSKSAIKNN